MLRVAAPYQSACQRLGLASAAAVLRHFTHLTADTGASVQIHPVSLESPRQQHIQAFLKIYRYARPGWRYWGRRSKAAGEFTNLQCFRQFGIRCAEPVAFGEQRDKLGRLEVAFILTAAIPAAIPLSDWLASQPTSYAGKPRHQVLRQLAGQLCQLHDAGHVHRDCFLRNILITGHGGTDVQTWWIDCPHGSRVPWAKQRWDYRVKDLASLDRLGRELASPTERLRFLRCYLGKQRYRLHGRQVARKVLAYTQRRWGSANAVHLA